MPEETRTFARWRATLVLVLAIGLVAVLARLPWPFESPPGLSLAEADLAIQSREITPIDLLTDPLASFRALVRLSNALFGWDVAAVRLPAAILGILTAIGCGLWYRRALGPWAGLVGGLLVATSYPMLVLSRQAEPAIGAAAMAALGLWCLWEGLNGHRERQRADATWHGLWIAAAGLLFGIGACLHPAGLLLLLVAPASAALLIWHQPDSLQPAAGHRWLWPVTGLACLLLAATPVIIDAVQDPGSFRHQFERDWNGDGQIERFRDPRATLDGLGETLLTLGWDGTSITTLGVDGWPLLDPLITLLSLAGLAAVLLRLGQPLHQISLLWLAGFGLLTASLAPGNPALLAPLTPVLYLLPLLGFGAIFGLIRRRWPSPTTTRPLLALAAAGLLFSIGWSLAVYRDWATDDRTYFAFNADLSEALAAVERLRPGPAPVYIAAPPHEQPLLDILGPDPESINQPATRSRVQRSIHPQTTLVIPRDGTGYLVTTGSDPLSPDLRAFLADQLPIDEGTTPSGTPAWQIWALGSATRERLPWTLPSLAFPDDFHLTGFSIRPDLGDVATTGQLPDPPRVVVTLVWDVPRGATPHLARIRLLPSSPATGDPESSAMMADAWLIASPPIEPGNRGRELVIVRVTLPVPDSADLIIDVQAGLLRSDGTILPPINPGANAAPDYIHLNRVQYIPGDTSPP